MILSPILSKASGSLGGITAMTTRNGLVFRTRAVPPDPATSYQTAIRSHFGTLAARWSSTLSLPQRAAWDLYAAHVKRANPLGDPRNVGGVGMYVRSNVPRLVASLSIIDTAPPAFNLGGFTQIDQLNAFAFATAVFFRIVATDLWAREVGGAMLVYVAPPVSAATTFYAARFRFAKAILGTTGPLLPGGQFATSPFPFSVGQRVNWRVQCVRADGRYSVSQQVSDVAAV